MTTTWKQISAPLRVAIAAPWLLITATATLALTPGGQALLLDYAHRPTSTVTLSSDNWTGTLDPARLPASVPLLDGGGSLPITDALLTGAGVYDLNSGCPLVTSDGSGGVFLGNAPAQIDSTGNVITSGNVYLGYGSGVYSQGSEGAMLESDNAGGVLLAGATLQIDSNGDLSAFGGTFYGPLIAENSLRVGAYTTLDNGAITTDGGGGLLVQSLSSISPIQSQTAVCSWGAGGPGSQPATPTTLADIVAAGQSYGWWQ